MTPTEYLNKCLELSERATGGPLEAIQPFADDEGSRVQVMHLHKRTVVHDSDMVAVCPKYDDAMLFAFSRDAIPKLCAALDCAIDTLKFAARGEECYGDAGVQQKNAIRALEAIDKLFTDEAEK